MKKEKTIFQEMLFNLNENVFPSTILSLKEMGMQYVHIAIDVRYSQCFFNYIGIAFPFDIRNISTFKNDKGENVSFIIFNLRNNGQLSISENMFVAQNGLSTLGNTVVIFNHFNEMFTATNFLLENIFIYTLSKEFTEKAKQLREEILKMRLLIDDMEKIIPKIKREVLTENSKN
jgi:hypothetical protein